MMTGARMLARAALAGFMISLLFAACAEGNQITGAGGAGATGYGGGVGAGPQGPGPLGSPCETDADCIDSTCRQVGEGKYCVIPCPLTKCPLGTYCTIIDGDPLCVPDLDNQCDKCETSDDCKVPSDECLTAPLGDKFCGRDCTIEGLCPNGFTCVDKNVYMGLGMPDAGAGDAGGGDAGAGDAGDAGVVEAGPPPTPSQPSKWCAPNSGFSCPCNEKRDGVTHACSVKNAAGECKGTETCKGSSGKWEGCTAKTPKAEECNGADDDCNMVVDEGDANALCATVGPVPPNATWVCQSGMCKLGACDPGWTAFPAGTPAMGCQCPLELGEPNGTCASVTVAGTVTDNGGPPLLIEGTLSGPADVDMWLVDTTDIDEVSTNSYHVSIAFTKPVPNAEFQMDVIRGDACSDAPSGPSAGITAYDWCVNADDFSVMPPKGELTCGPEIGINNCNDHSSKYFIRVYRKLGAQGTCTKYQITVTASGGECDLTQSCMGP